MRSSARHLWHDTASEGTPFARMLPSVIGPGVLILLVHVRNKAIDREVGVGAFRSVRDQPPTPEIGRQLFQRRVREDA
jgi:hypothetical protein